MLNLLSGNNVEKMYTSLKREEVKREIRKIIKEEEVIRGWKKVEIIKNLEFVWNNTQIEEGLGIGSRMSPVLAEILMKRWKREKIYTEIRIRKFRRYVDDSIGIWKGKKR